jgi:heterodisulfide reductase subunit A
MIDLTIDNKKISVEPGKSVLEVCQGLGIKIPTLCHHKALPAYGACRLCLVEVEERGRTRIQASCLYPAREGLVVRTDTEKVVKTRRIMAELLLARCPGSQKVKEVAGELGVTESRFPKKNEDCILCGMCIRVCSERMKSGAIDFSSRGNRRKVGPAYDRLSPVCMACGACKTVCPTGAVSLDKVSTHKTRPILSEFDAELVDRPSIYIPYQQAIPKVPVIDRETCMHFRKNGEIDACRACEEFCEAKAIDFSQQDELVDVDVGAVVLAPGYTLFDADQKLELGCAYYPNVVTSLQFERLLSASGPHMGRILRPSDLTLPKRIAFVQCVGSRDKKHDYCSSVCCMYATKEAIIAKEHEKDLDCEIFYMDLRAFGKGFDAYYERAKELGVKYTRCRPSSVEQIEETKNLRISCVDESGRFFTREFDLVVLSSGLRPPRDVLEIAEKCGVKVDENGFAITSKWNPVESSRPGVFVCGPFSEPKDIPETVMEASGASAKSMVLLAEKRGALVTQREWPAERDVSGEEPKIGVFVCHCGRNIGGVVDVPAVVEYAKTLPNVVLAERNLYTCSTDTQEAIKKAIREHNLNRVIVASCTPRTHEPLFRSTIREAGLNSYLFEMANIRDQCSWVHMHEPAAATRKSKDLVRMAVAKARMIQPLLAKTMPVTGGALIIGGGMSGMTAALDLADQGFEVNMVEKESVLGGNLRHVPYLLGGEKTHEQLEKTIKRVESHQKIKIWKNSRITAIDGFVGNFKTKILRDDKENEVEHGVVVVATGAKEHKPEEYLYGTDERVITQRRLEEKISGQEFKAKRVVMIQCVGSREGERMYCSRICCSQALKNALKIKEDFPDTEVFILYRELRAYGFREKYYTEARKRGIRFIRYEAEEKPAVTAEEGRLRVEVKDRVLGAMLEIDADLVVLAPAIVPQDDAEEIAKMLKVPLTKEKFFLEAHMKLRPIDFATEGIFVCGLAHSPKQMEECIAQAGGAASRAATILSKKEMELEATISEVVDANCDGCAYCIDPCPYKALTLVEYMRNGAIKKTVQRNEALCKGCGVCMATCPKKGIFVRNFKLEQLQAMVETALEPVGA